MKAIRLLEFGTPDDFVDLCDIVKYHTKQDSLWVEDLAKVIETAPGQVQRFMEHPIRARTMLKQFNTSLVKYQAYVVKGRRIYASPMEQHKFPWAQTCEELFISWSKYEKSHPFEGISWDDCWKTVRREHHVESFVLFKLHLAIIFS